MRNGEEVGQRSKTSTFGLMAGRIFWLLTVSERLTRMASLSLRTLQHRVSSIWMKPASRSTVAMVGAGEHDGGTDDNGSSIIEGERGAANVSIEAMSEGETDAV